MKHAITGKVIVPKIYKRVYGAIGNVSVDEKQWLYIAEKVYVTGKWVKLFYYEFGISLDKFNRITPSDSILNVLNFNKINIA